MRHVTLFSLAAVLALVAAGCVSQPGASVNKNNGAAADVPFTDLAAQGAKATADLPDGVRMFSWEGVGPGGESAILVTRQIGDSPPDAVFDVDHRVGFVEVNLSYTGDSSLQAFLLDEKGRTQCGTIGAYNGGKTQLCTVPVPENLTSKTPWKVHIGTGYGGGAPGMAYKLAVSLHPLSHVTRGDPLAGVDRSIVFDPVDTKAGGSESNIGVLPNGHIVAQFGTKTMLSTDDGKTWKDIAPPTTGTITFDPMLYVDDYTGTIYVDQLYVGCSVLAWSTDEGASWLSNPFACGVPSDDHQKVVTGPNQLPVAPCAEIYYSWTSITVGASGLFVARSLDCGANFVTSKVIDDTGGLQWDNDMLGADRAGNVYVPVYLCNDGGSMAVGVSNDHGTTFNLVKIDPKHGACTDPDPGFAFDSKGGVYVAYHREDGVWFVASKDHGKTWTAPTLVSPPSLKSFVHVDAVAGDEGKLAILYRATPDTANGPDLADGWAAWNMYVAFVDGADSSAPTVKTGMINPANDPTQRGPVCTGGVSCAGGSRNLLDFVDIAVGPDGRVYAVYADGCQQTCETPADSRKTTGVVGVVEDGPRLFEAGAPWAHAKNSP